jgi:hypothetical protein
VVEQPRPRHHDLVADVEEELVTVPD